MEPNTGGQKWWSFALRGVIAVLFGIVALIWTGMVLELLVFFVGFFVLVNAVFTLVIGVPSDQQVIPRWVLLLSGILGLVIGISALIMPVLTAAAFVYFIAFWALLAGAGDLAVALHMKDGGSSRWLLVISGIFSVLVAIVMVLFPLLGAVVLVQVLGIYAIAFGVLGIIAGFSLKGTAVPETGHPVA